MRHFEAADAALFGAMGLPHIRFADGTEVNPQVGLRKEFDLYAAVRPIRAIPGAPRRWPTRALRRSTSR
ncbi:MAG TPA: isocitrate/isopropylmalate family dehydrogenase [Accumulibacter sp.]|uniref:isocitrate/isopropylmalate family dehydrogenase n=1 Tax=Accumulibacter sp. TaxID=2053492 RepID=UPI002C72A941|nr:isocitrate/isopropylmalate family dehydrogenase [Accumulibacter sp.]HRD90877.1 isocitrate/isopropylmalate family dehydrogenase [Accumulibacter sp.]